MAMDWLRLEWLDWQRPLASPRPLRQVVWLRKGIAEPSATLTSGHALNSCGNLLEINNSAYLFFNYEKFCNFAGG